MKKPISAIIVDDEQHAVDSMAALLKYFTELQVIKTFTNPQTALDFVLKEKPGVIFLDISMPEMSGIDFARKLMDWHITVPVIFITAHEKFILQALRNNAVDYLLKPVSQTELADAIWRVKLKTEEENKQNLLNFLNQNHIRKLRFNTRTGFITFSEEDILFILADGVYSKIQLKTGKEITVSQNLGKLENLLQLANLVKIHRSCIVNGYYIFEVNRSKKKCSVCLDEKTFQLPVSSKGLQLLDELICKRF
jgi:DNA-binding LytR/AlgR family response regulator